jgi:hypothetical protein
MSLPEFLAVGENSESYVVDRIESLVVASCDVAARMTPQATRDAWAGWNAVYQLPRKEPHAILQDTVVYRLSAVSGSLKDKHALAAYHSQGPGWIYVLMVDALVGWQCTCRTMPPVEKLDANLLVTAGDFSWTFGSSEEWRRSGLYGGPVFLESNQS